MRADHKLHFTYGFIASVMGFFACGIVTDNTWIAILAGFILSFLIGLGKEVYDRYRTNGTGFDLVDLLFTGLGGGTFCTFISILVILS